MIIRLYFKIDRNDLWAKIHYSRLILANCSTLKTESICLTETDLRLCISLEQSKPQLDIKIKKKVWISNTKGIHEVLFVRISEQVHLCLH